jgi:DnaJ-class molecular chaperone
LKDAVQNMTDPYTVLGVPADATQADIAHAYRCRLRDHHPDLQPHQTQRGNGEQLRRIVAAYALLRDPRRRAEYDRAHPTETREGPRHINITHTRAWDNDAYLSAGPVYWQPHPHRHG